MKVGRGMVSTRRGHGRGNGEGGGEQEEGHGRIDPRFDRPNGRMYGWLTS